MVNRNLLIVKYRQPFVAWVNEGSPAYLIHEYASEAFEDWLHECYLPLFENILG